MTRKEDLLDITLFLTHVAEWLGVAAIGWLLSLAPKSRFAPVTFLYARRDGLAALFLGSAAVLFAVAFNTVGMTGLVSRINSISGPAKDLLNPFVLALVSLLPFIAALLTRGQPPLSMGWSSKRFRSGLQAGLAVALLTIFLRNRVYDIVGGLKSDEINYLFFALGIALAEETIFRGYIQLRLVSWMGETRGWVAASLFFAVFRFPALLASGDTAHALFGLLLIFGESLVAGWLMRKSGHVLAPALYRAVSIWMNVFI